VTASFRRYAAREAARVQVLSERGGIIAVNKPAALSTEPDRRGDDSVLLQVAEALRLPPSRLHAISRLDVGVSGVLLLAADARARAKLLAARERGQLVRRYCGLAAGILPAFGEWNDALSHDGRKNRTLSLPSPSSRPALTRYAAVAQAAPALPELAPTSLLALSPVSGRTHQLRVHAAAHGAPLLGDRKYGGPMRRASASGAITSFSQIMLHAAWVRWDEEQTSAPLAVEIVETWRALNGEPAALERALAGTLLAIRPEQGP
jgi:23S rRNA-/tRNA-specific pseudouridylate synthase